MYGNPTYERVKRPHTHERLGDRQEMWEYKTF